MKYVTLNNDNMLWHFDGVKIRTWVSQLSHLTQKTRKNLVTIVDNITDEEKLFNENRFYHAHTYS